ncbi:hypothetical protein ACQY0O_000811 [Thecaphora frezii]
MSTPAPPCPPRSASSRRPPSWNPLKYTERKIFEFHQNMLATFSLGMLEPWEVILVLTVVTVVTALLWYSLFYHFPSHLQRVVRRAIYYIYGYTPASPSKLGSVDAATTLGDLVMARVEL